MKTPSPQCPLCHQGQLHQLTLMDVWGCQFCRHLFEWSAERQTLKVLDLSPAILWSWNGRFWQRGHQAIPTLSVGLVCGAIALAVLPAVLLGVANYVFPPLPDSSLFWFPLAWQGLSLISHSIFVGWVMAEAYQFPAYLRFKIRLRQWLGA